ncbi:hypothetical protein [Helicobacter sp. 13S00477-4]|uniref:hypothetical protein n=1 Tax=Helicobacter sp. 13S00477-4 TaxID=1905759 RepID=UPI000BA727EA|nr:hypothetical protein [Helicobacter sp. 13S00477-4]PAF52550.1 hypothetical protein BKH44_01865 [Helicobacter sp. 13S00477-4]
MIFEFIFSSTKTKSSIKHFIHFLQFYANKRNLDFSDMFEKQKNHYSYSFFIDTEPQIALDFANDIANRLPMSIDFNFVEIKTHQNLSLKWKKNPIKKIAFIDVLQTKEISNENSKTFCDLFDWVKNIQAYGQNITDKISLIEAFKKTASKLKNAESLFIKTANGVREFSFINKSENIMFWDLSNLSTYMRLQNTQSHLLASYEKPMTKLCPKEVFVPSLLQDKNVEINTILADDLFLSTLGIFVLKMDMGYVFFKNHPKSKNYDLSYEHYPLVKKQDITISESGFLINKTIKKDSKNIFNIISKHFDEKDLPPPRPKKNTPLNNHQKLIIFLSKNHPTNILIKEGISYKTPLKISFEANPKIIIQKIQNDYKNGDKLLKNFNEYFKEILENIYNLDDIPIQSQNLMDIFCSASFILGYQSKFDLELNNILDHAKKFVRDKGPRIDFKLIKEEEKIKLDYTRIIRSAMSFRIAGLDEATLSYGFIDSMAEFLGNFIRDTSTNFAIKDILICGDMLGEKIFLDKILHYLPKNINIHLPKDGYIDYL